jgi:transposase
MKIMHTMASEARTKGPRRRFYSPEFKHQVVGQCRQPGASIAAVALGHGVNTNIVHRCLREHSQGTLAVQQLAFVPVTFGAQPISPSPQSELPTLPDIRIEVHRASSTVIGNWPLQGGASCAQWLREWLA